MAGRLVAFAAIRPLSAGGLSARVHGSSAADGDAAGTRPSSKLRSIRRAPRRSHQGATRLRRMLLPGSRTRGIGRDVPEARLLASRISPSTDLYGPVVARDREPESLT